MTNDSHALCAKCKLVKPLKSFKKLASPSQMRSWGKEGNVRMTITSKNCKECRPKPQPLSKLSPARIKELIASGETIYKDPAKGEQVLANRIERSKAAMVRSGKEHQYNKKRARWVNMRLEVATLHRLFDLRVRNLRTRFPLPRGLGHHSSPTDFATLCRQLDRWDEVAVQLIAYTQACVDALKRIKDLLKSKDLQLTPPPPSWQHLLTEEESTTIQSLWDVLPKNGLRESARLNITKE